jgi:Chitobiase/beta-hexosaminidase C-terminal domain
MGIISVTVTLSEEQIVAGIPRTVSITTNVSSLIFYTLDGSIPTLFSTMYTGPIFMPTNSLSIVLNILATNGTDVSPIVTETFVTNMVDGTNARLAHSGTTAIPGSDIADLYPFGTNPIQPNVTYVSPAEVGITVDNPALPSTSTGFDGAGNPVGFTNQPYDSTNYSIRYSTTDREGQTGLGIGNLPGKVTFEPVVPPPETTDQNSQSMFDPRAFVIFQDVSTENPEDPPYINRMSFFLENPETARDGNHFFSSGLDAPPVNGTFLRSHHNPRTNTITYYYLDTWTNKWIISTMPFQPNSFGAANMSQIAMAGSAPGAKYVFEWLPFTRRVLF